MITSSIQDILMMYVWEDDLDLTSREEIVAHAQSKLFNFGYPFYDSKLKDEFEKNFIRHFYTREIGSESIALFKLRLQDYLYLNHEKWQRLYQNVDETINPFTNIDIKTIRDINEEENTNRDREQEDKESDSRTNKDSEQTTSKQDNTVNSHADDFTRSLEQTPPDERLNITAQNGVGLIDYASNIQENKNINEANQTSKVDGSGTTKRDNEQKGERNKNINELENQKRALEQLYNEQKVGRTWNKSFVEVYNEYVEHFYGIQHLMFKDMEKLFLGVF